VYQFSLDDRTNDLTTVRDDLDALKDEHEIAQQSANDSLALLRSTELQMKKLERTISSLCDQLEKRGILDEYVHSLDSELQLTVHQCISNVKGGGMTRRLSNSTTAIHTHTIIPTPAAASIPTSPAKSIVSSSPVEKEKRASAKTKAKAAKDAENAQRAAEEDAHIQRIQEETARAQAEEAAARRSHVESERARSMAAEESRRDALLEEADALSESLMSPTSTVRLAKNRRTTSQLLADPDLASPTSIQSTQSQDEHA
jgi:hypothetical protein